MFIKQQQGQSTIPTRQRQRELDRCILSGVGTTVLKILVLPFLAIASQATAQQVVRVPLMADSTPEQVIARLFPRGPRTNALGPSNVSGIMRQRGMVQSTAKLDRLADLLTEVAIAGRSGDDNRESYNDANTAREIICYSGLPDPPLPRYAGALDRLIRIHKEAGPTPIRSGALRCMTAVPGRERALQYIRQVAVSLDGTAVFAVDVLISEAMHGGYANLPASARQEAQNMLRDLYTRKLVKEGQADRILAGYAIAQGWTR